MLENSHSFDVKLRSAITLVLIKHRTMRFAHSTGFRTFYFKAFESYCITDRQTDRQMPPKHYPATKIFIYFVRQNAAKRSRIT